MIDFQNQSIVARVCHVADDLARFGVFVTTVLTDNGASQIKTRQLPRHWVTPFRLYDLCRFSNVIAKNSRNTCFADKLTTLVFETIDSEHNPSTFFPRYCAASCLSQMKPDLSGPTGPRSRFVHPRAIAAFTASEWGSERPTSM